MAKKLLLSIFLCLMCVSASADVYDTKKAAGHIIEDEGTKIKQRVRLNFTGAGVTCADSGGKTKCTITSGSGGGGGGATTDALYLVQEADDNLNYEVVLPATVDSLILANGNTWKSVGATGDVTIRSDGTTQVGADRVTDSMPDWGTGANQVSMADIPSYQQSVVVAKDGDDASVFTTIQGAIDSISDNAVGKPYVVKIFPGTYAETITMEDFVSIDGEGRRGSVVIDGSVTFAAVDSDQASIKDLSII